MTAKRHTGLRISKTRSGAWLLLTLAVTTAVYWPGLHGGYLFDDYPNIVDNTDLHIANASLPSLASAALSSPSSEFRRPLASLSFAANYLLTGLDPFWMKLTNLVIHLLNGILVYILALRLLQTSAHLGGTTSDRDPLFVALLIATGWLLLPINLTAVLYTVQRMESMANVFVLLGLIGYVKARQRMCATGRGFITASASLVLATGTGLLVKETAVMTPLYAALIEWTLFRCRSHLPELPEHRLLPNRNRDWRVLGLFLIVLVLPLVTGLAWTLPGLLKSEAWATRNFDLPQRLMSEARIIVDYIRWTLLPTPHELSFYHDDYIVSTGWLTPWTTLPCILAVACLGILILWLRTRVPLAALGLALFFGAQSLTASILPLELIYEHRNYFASFGLLLAVIPILASGESILPIARYTLLSGLLLLWMAETAATSLAWSTPLGLATDLAQRAPASPRALYDLGRTYVILSHYDPNSPFTAAAYQPLEQAMQLPDASILPEQALIMMNARMHRPIKDEWWDSLIVKLTRHSPGMQNNGALAALTHCVANKECNLPVQWMMDAFLTALSHPNPDARLLANYGDYAWNVLGDRTLGERMARAAVNTAPDEPVYRITLARMFIVEEKLNAAHDQIAKLEHMNVGGRLNGDIAALNAFLSQHN